MSASPSTVSPAAIDSPLAAAGVGELLPSGRIVQCDARWCQMVGLGREALTALSLQELTHADDRVEQQAQLDALAAGEVDRSHRNRRLLHARGHTIVVDLMVCAVRDGAGRLQRLTIVVIEVPEGTGQAARALSTGQATMLSRTSHVLRTPLNAVIGFAQLLLIDRTHPLDELQRARIEHIERAGIELLALVDEAMARQRADIVGTAPDAPQATPARSVSPPADPSAAPAAG